MQPKTQANVTKTVTEVSVVTAGNGRQTTTDIHGYMHVQYARNVQASNTQQMSCSGVHNQLSLPGSDTHNTIHWSTACRQLHAVELGSNTLHTHTLEAGLTHTLAYT